MAAQAERKRIKLLWEIEKFPLCLQRRGYNLMSKDFFLEDLMENTRWNLVLYPRGNDFTCLKVCLARGQGGPEIIEIDYELSLCRTDNKRTLLYQTTNRGFRRGEINEEFSGFRSREEILGREREIFLTGWEKLTIQCFLRKSGQELPDSKFLKTYDMLGFVNSRMEWCLRSTGNHKVTIPLSNTHVSAFLCPLQKHELKIRVSRDLDISGRIKVKKRSLMELFVICSIDIKTTNGECVELFRGECFFESGKTDFKWEIPVVLDGGKIMRRDRLLQFPNDKLTLICGFEFSDGRTYSDDSMQFSETPTHGTAAERQIVESD